MITTDRLTIRRITAADWPALQRIWADFSASPFACYDTPHPTDAEAVRARVSRWADYEHSREHMFFAVCLEGQIIGYVAFNQREASHEVGYCFHSACHGRGYARESLRALMDHLRTQGITRITAGTALRNTPSVALLTALGFTLTGTETLAFHKDAQGRDVVFEGGLFQLDLPR